MCRRGRSKPRLRGCSLRWMEDRYCAGYYLPLSILCPPLSSPLFSSPLLSSPLLSLQLVFEPESAESEWLRLSSAERGQNHEYCVSIIGGWRLNKKCLFLGGGKELLAPNCV